MYFRNMTETYRYHPTLQYNTYRLDEETTQATYHGLMLYVHQSLKVNHISK